MKIIIPILIYYFFNLELSFCQSRDIFNKENSIKYAQFLIENGDYRNAAGEYSRLLQLEIDNDSLRLQTINLYRKAKQNDSALFYFHGFETKNLAFEKEYINLLLATEELKQLTQFVKASSLNENEKQLAALHLLMYKGNWKKARKQLENVAIEPLSKIIDYNKIVEKGIKSPPKNMVLTVGMSAIIPGLGKVYAGSPWEGLSTFIITGFLAFSAYRGFIQKEEASIPGWLYGAGFIGFYAGNIYGTAKQVKKFNQMQQLKIREDLEALLFD